MLRSTKVNFLTSVKAIFVVLLYSVCVTNAAEEAVIYESFTPCDDSDVLLMERQIGGLPGDSENYWNGTFSFDRWPYVYNVHLTVAVDNPAKLYLTDYDNGTRRVLSNVKKYHIMFDKPSQEIGTINFWLRAPQGEAFPNIVSIRLNEEEVCRNPKAWKPTFLGHTNNPDTYHGYNIDDQQSNNDNEFANFDQTIYNKNTDDTISEPLQPQIKTTHPWFASIHRITRQGTKYFVCGASIINEQTVLTAASCFFGFADDSADETANPNYFIVEVGQFNRTSGRQPNVYQIAIKQIVLHYGYQPYRNEDNNLGIVILSENLKFNKFVQPIKIETKYTAMENTVGTVTGWGPKVRSSSLSTIELPITSRAACLRSDPSFYETYLTSNSYCAGFETGSNLCGGFGGSGMYVNTDGVIHLRGMVSIAPSNTDHSHDDVCFLNNFVVLTDLQPYSGWINDNLWRSFVYHF